MKTNLYLFVAFIFCMTLRSNQAMAQHDDICDCAGEYMPGDRTTKIKTINPFTNQEETLTVEERDGYYIWQGDIILGKIGEIVSRNVFSHTAFWPDNTMPFHIEPGFSPAMLNLIAQAAMRINTLTNLYVIPHTTETNYVKISPGTSCSSAIGIQPFVLVTEMTLSSSCSFGTIMHEFLHAAGIAHEQARIDRDNYISINFNNIQPGKEHNFYQKLHSSWSHHGEYDYGSIMHYGAYAFAIDPTIKTITTLGGQAIGQRTNLSLSDIEAINSMYPLCTAANLTYNSSDIQPGRYKTDGSMYIGGTIPDSTWALMSAGVEIKLTPGSSIGFPSHSGPLGGRQDQVKLVLKGCDID